jgi:Mn-dependent DtxR family transcriptional regulator
MRKIDQIKDQIRRLLDEEGVLTANQLSGMMNPPVSAPAISIALNQLYQEGEVVHLPGQGWSQADDEDDSNAVPA